MNREQVIQWAREVGFSCLLPEEAIDMLGGVFADDENITSALQRFADLVAAHEREECAKVCESLDCDGAPVGYKLGAIDCA